MKSIILSCIIVFISLNYSYSQTGIIKGRILTEKGIPAKNVVITLNDNKELEVDSSGHYKFTNLPANTYEIKAKHISFTSQTVAVTLKKGEVKTIDFALRQSENTLKEVLVSGHRGMVEQHPSNSLRVQTPLIELAQNVQVINSEILSKQQSFNLADGLYKNVSGISRQTHWNDLYVNISMRGSQIQAFRNGMNIVASYWGPLSEDMATVERVEFIKGPAGFMMSSGDPAGIYNVVTKKPTGEQKGEVTFSLGSFDMYRTTLDLDGRLSSNGKLLYRLNVAGSSSASFRPNEDSKRLTIAPVISYQLGENTKAIFEYTYQKAKMTDIGSAYLFSPFGFKSLPRDFTFSTVGLEPLNIDEHNTFLTIEHDFSSNWKLTAQGSYFNYNQIGASSWPKDVFPDGKMLRKTDIWDAQSEMQLGQLFLNGNFNTGKVKHRILAGIDLGKKEYFADWNTGLVLDTLNGGEFDPQNPIYSFDTNRPDTLTFDRSLPLKTRAFNGGGLMNSSYSSIYVQDELGFFDNSLRITLAARYTSMSVGTWGDAPINSKKVTPRLGFSYSIDKNTSVYGLYDQAFLPQRQGNLHDGSEIKPITGDNIELGAKRNWADGRWNTTLSAYRIVKNHELTSYGPRPEDVIEIGQKRVQGIEFDIKGELYKGINLIANYAYTDAIISKVNQGVNTDEQLNFFEGQRLAGSDKHIVNVWLDYEIQSGVAKGLGIMAGMNSNLDRGTGSYSIDLPETNIEDYLRFDAGLSYRKDRWYTNLNIQNLFDKYLVEGGGVSNFSSGSVYSWQAGAPRNFRMTVGYKF
ncbi:TonB-dependent receptor [Sphingobacterium shayense]|uniref:TonB-dependent siderophore receptor n=1 Tax=Sphingobacterium shayense TaxID=626343 RepID=UPI001555541A|nr:TonB-dependent siderophore receptor [Sphingobacterium shayense]NQD70649.1 TonB-dependent receptor [Sphingobacterium shayense]